MLQKDLTDKTKAWNEILQSVRANTADIQTWSRRNGDGCYFRPDTMENQLIIRKSKERNPSCRINVVRTIDYQQFERVANHFNQYIKGDIQRTEMQNLGWNTSYIISLIVRFL
jgi:hypothetical protein